VAVFVDQLAQHVDTFDPLDVPPHTDSVAVNARCGCRDVQAEAPVRSSGVVVRHVLGRRPLQVPVVPDSAPAAAWRAADGTGARTLVVGAVTGLASAPVPARPGAQPGTRRKDHTQASQAVMDVRCRGLLPVRTHLPRSRCSVVWGEPDQDVQADAATEAERRVTDGAPASALSRGRAGRGRSRGDGGGGRPAVVQRRPGRQRQAASPVWRPREPSMPPVYAASGRAAAPSGVLADRGR
jgi:hypothetical protein